ncbi:type IV secretory system conjugative DNA transfer family protein [Candidatus Protofrankia datiscae]|nr:FtsK/SpoIIIE domain-containing protein [Candidatus Protofrankia datiscae]
MTALLADLDPAARVTVRHRRPVGVTPEDSVGVTLGKLAGWLLRAGLAGLARLAVRYRRTSLALLIVLLAVDRVGWRPLAVAVALLAGGVLVWRIVHPGSYRLWLAGRLAAWWRRWTRYAPRWGRLMARHNLTVTANDVEQWPRLLRVRTTRARDSLLVGLRPGQSPDDLDAVTVPLAHALRADEVQIRVHRPGRVWVDVRRRDLLATPIPALPIPTTPDLRALPVGLREDGAPWTLGLLGTHTLLAGATGTGKGSVLHSILRGLAPLIAAGVVEVWGIDPKGGMELYPARGLFTRYADGSTGEMADLLMAGADYTRIRAAELKTRRLRMLTPSVETPFVLLLVDEFAFLSAYQPDHRLAASVDIAVQIICSQGRGPGVGLLVAVQDPSKDVLPYRQLFPTRIALRLDEPVQVDMVLGEGARARGARCDAIPPWAHGVGYVRLDRQREPIRVRAAYPTDTDITTLARDYPAPLAIPGPRTAAADMPAVPSATAVTDPYLTEAELDPEWQAFIRSRSRAGKTLH